jgi:23S rRNA (guanosine2251-2'-O)-methyltransferase
VTNYKTVLIIHNVRSTHNVGSLLRSADGFGVSHVYLTGYTPYPEEENDERLPHIRAKIDRQVQKTALGAQKNIAWSHIEDINKVIEELKSRKFTIAALEQTINSVDLASFKSNQNIALIVGNEVDGIDENTLRCTDIQIEIPMRGKKESFNVAVAGSIALYHLQNFNHYT